MPRNLALVPKGDPFPLEDIDLPNGTSNDTSSMWSTSTSLRDQLTAVYESYAVLYPNPALTKERQERERLLSAISAANHAVALNPPIKKKKKRSQGVWSRLFFGADSQECDDDGKDKTCDQDEDDDDRLVYTDMTEDDDEARDGDLCGTMYSLELSVIPDDAHSLARFHIASTYCSGGASNSTHHDTTAVAKHHQQQRPRLVQTSWERAGSHVWTVIGLGAFVQYDPKNGSSQVQYTTDRDELLQYASTKNSTTSSTFVLDHVRAVSVGPNFLMVCWGFLDGFVVMYRRLQQTASAAAGEPSTVVCWEPVACVGPSARVAASLGDVFAATEDDDGGVGLPSSVLMHVSALVPLVLEETPTGIPALVLAIARLGGFVELLPLPHGMWYGPEIPPSNKKRKRSHHRHHYAENVINLSNHPDAVISLSTANYHSDIVCMEGIRSSWQVGGDWNDQLYPEPPAEFVLMTSGRGNGQEVASFHNVSIIFPENPHQQHQDPIGFSVHVTLAEAVPLGHLGPDITIFANKTIMRHWRKPRHVHLREADGVEPLNGEGVLSSKQPSPRVTTISVAAPMMRWAWSTNFQAAAVDAHGGLTLLDCRLLDHMASHQLEEEIRLSLFVHNEQLQLVAITQPRSLTTSMFSFPLSDQCGVVDVKWLLAHGATDMSLLCLSNVESSLLVATPSTSIGAAKIVRVPISPSHRAVLFSTASGHLYYVAFDKKDRLMVVPIKELEPAEIVQSLINQSKFKEAIHASKQLSVDDQVRMSPVIEKFKRDLWETQLDLECLAAVTDVSYIVKEALEFGGESHHASLVDKDIALFRSLHQLALLKLSSIRLGEILSIGGPDGVYGIEQLIKTRLVRLGTYELLCRYYNIPPTLEHFCNSFLEVSLGDLALSAAESADIVVLSILYFRHFHNLSNMAFVERLPVTLPPLSYCHLLPVVDAQKSTTRSAFLSGSPDAPVFEWYQMPEYLVENFDLVAVLGKEDELLVLTLESMHDPSKEETDCVNAIESWYLNRMKQLDRYSMSLSDLVEFGTLSMAALGFGGKDSPSDSSSVNQIEQMVAVAITMNSFYMDQLSARNSFPAITHVAVEDVLCMSHFDLIGLTLDGCPSSVDLFTRYKKYLLPLLEVRTPPISPMQLGAVVSEYCLSKMQKAAVSEDGDDIVDVFLRGSELCAVVAKHSSVSRPKEERMIQNWRDLFRFVQSFYVSISGAPRLDELSSRRLIEHIWTTFESLPAKVSPNEADGGDIMEAIDQMYQNLVFADIAANWPIDGQFSVRIDRDVKDTVKTVCNSFLAQIDSSEFPLLPEEVSGLLNKLTSDVSQIFPLINIGKADVQGMFSTYLLKPLLDKEQIQLLGEIVVHFEPDWLDKKNLCDDIRTFINTAITSDIDDPGFGNSIQAALCCEDMIASCLPELQSDFDAIKLSLDVAYYLGTMSTTGKRYSPDFVKDSEPLDLVDTLLTDSPRMIIHGCEDWANERWATQANATLRLLSTSVQQNSESDPTPPPLPGGAVFRLAEMLGLVDATSVVIVKSLVSFHGFRAGLMGAGAAVCRSATIDAFAQPLENVQQIVFWPLSFIVSCRDYEDTETAAELARKYISFYRHKFLNPELEWQGLLLSAFRKNEFLNTENEGQGPPPLLSIYHFFGDTKREYGADPKDLFLSLRDQASQGLVDLSLVSGLVRYLIFWCLAQSSGRFPERAGMLPTRSTRPLLELALALMNLIEDKRNRELQSTELLRVVENQIAVLVDEEPNLEAQVNEDLVRRLIGRGYSPWGSRRAVMMSGNHDFDTALRWAVTHSLDPNFDEPIVIIAPLQPTVVNMHEMKLIQRVLHEVADPNFTSKISSQNVAEEPKANFSALPQAPHSRQLTLSKDEFNDSFCNWPGDQEGALESSNVDQSPRIEEDPLTEPKLEKLETSKAESNSESAEQESSHWSGDDFFKEPIDLNVGIDSSGHQQVEIDQGHNGDVILESDQEVGRLVIREENYSEEEIEAPEPDVNIDSTIDSAFEIEAPVNGERDTRNGLEKAEQYPESFGSVDRADAIEGEQFPESFGSADHAGAIDGEQCPESLGSVNGSDAIDGEQYPESLGSVELAFAFDESVLDPLERNDQVGTIEHPLGDANSGNGVTALSSVEAMHEQKHENVSNEFDFQEGKLSAERIDYPSAHIDRQLITESDPGNGALALFHNEDVALAKDKQHSNDTSQLTSIPTNAPAINADVGGWSRNNTEMQPSPPPSSMGSSEDAILRTESMNLRTQVSPPPPPPPRSPYSLAIRAGSPDRRLLRQRGEEELRKLRLSCSPSSLERHRLIEEGRRLLQKAREASGSPIKSLPTPTRTHPHPVKSNARTMPPSPKVAATPTHASRVNGSPSNHPEVEPKDDGWDFEDDI